MNAQKTMKIFESQKGGLSAAAPLTSGSTLPWLGLGVWQTGTDEVTERLVLRAIEEGYRSIDTARIYGNERGVGRAVRGCGIAREQLFITTKVWNDDIRAGRVQAAFERSLELLGLDYVDLYLVHWPIAGKVQSTWKEMEKLLSTGRVKSLGVSNHLEVHLKEILAHADVPPAVNQIEFHPYLQSRSLIEFCHAERIQPEAWSPLMVGGPVLRDPVIVKIAAEHGKSAAQVILRWDLQCGVVTIPKTTRLERLPENANVFDFTLSDAEMSAIAALDRGERTGGDPMHVNF